MPASAAARLRRQATARAYHQRKRAEAKAAKAAMDHPAPAMLDEVPPVIAHQEPQAPAPVTLAAAPAAPAALPVPPLPDLDAAPVDVPAYQPFHYATADRLTPDALAVITLFHETWLQAPDLSAQVQACATPDAKRRVFRQAQLDAERTVEYLRQQYREACVGPDGPQSQEALQVKRNLDWAEALLARQV